MASRKMKNCKVCGQEIAKSAKVCPYCGAKQKKSKLLIILIILAVLILIGALGSGGSSDSSSDTSAEKTSESEKDNADETTTVTEAAIEYKDVNVDTLINDLEENALSASSTYKDQYLAIHGILGNIDSDGDYISLDPLNGGFTFLSNVQCYIKTDEQLEVVKTLKKNQEIVVNGKVTSVGEVLGYSIDIDSIEVLESSGGGSSDNQAENKEQEDTGEAVSQQNEESAENAGDRSVNASISNAGRKAQDYLAFTFFSRSGLINQLEYEGFDTAEVEAAVDELNVDWNEQALGKAKDYLDMMAFSESGLKKQLEYEGFSEEEASYGAENCGADWNEQAVKKAKDYLDMTSFSHSGLVDQLEYEGFTSEQAEYGVSQNGL